MVMPEVEPMPILPSVGGFADWLGIRITGWDSSGPHLALEVRPEFINRNGAVHGGLLLTLLDSACSLAGLSLENGQLKGRVVAVSLTTNFVAPAVRGTLHARAALGGGGRKLALVEGEIRDDSGALIATASGVTRRIQEEKP